ncbi:uridylate-specific endoribonuclease-like isoform X1 [Lytechinus pictus]|uniref:uridylate-specific endoribonuclease-like isoform X1 n=1 Tax=Lytechinus pictus TaxID=7653 RepID=UPI0030BA1896
MSKETTVVHGKSRHFLFRLRVGYFIEETFSIMPWFGAQYRMKYSLYILCFLPTVFGITFTPGTHTCQDRCLDHYNLTNICQCTDNCELFGDCCLDFYFNCVDPPVAEDSCEGLCGLFLSGKPCQCNSGCVSYGDCCDDYSQFCDGGIDPGSTCEGRCDDGYNPDLECQCNDQCETFNNCCDDYIDKCIGVDPGSTCEGRCDDGYDPDLACQCNDLCETYNNCCDDYNDKCIAPLLTCDGRCDIAYDPDLPCQCDDQCGNSGSCCDDYEDQCVEEDLNLCKGRCGVDYDSSLPCQCNDQCPTYFNCCPDYVTECSGSCDGRCDNPFDGDQPCQCNSACITHGDCCLDYNEICLNGTAPKPINQSEITQLAELLWTLDVNRLTPNDYVINKQALVDDGNNVDQSADPFFTSLNESALSSRTYQAFIALMDNYISETRQEEVYTLEELEEIEEFLDAVFESDVMTATTDFFIDKGQFIDETEYREWAKMVWFGNYSRKESDPFFDSSGFEHVFMGETKSSSVSGFHNWLRFYFQEKEDQLDYYGYVRENFPDQMGLNFVWKGAVKELGSVIIGSSPEFEFAMFSLCFRIKGGSQCEFTLDGSPSKIQTYKIRDPGYIGSAYFVV